MWAVWALFAALTVPPALVANVAKLESWEGSGRVLIYVAGLGLTFGIYLLVVNFASPWGNRALYRQLRTKLERGGLRPDEWSGWFVGFSPDPRPRNYEGNSVWDIGYLFLVGDQLCYFGEETRFVLDHEQITAVHLGPGSPGWLAVSSAYVMWRDGARNKEGTFNVRPGDVASLLEMDRQARALASRLQAWRENPPRSRPLPLACPELGPPDIGPVTSASRREAVQPRKVIRDLILVVAVAAGIASLFGLPLGLLPTFVYGALLLSGSRLPAPPDVSGWYVVAVACAVFLLSLVPCWRYRDPPL